MSQLPEDSRPRTQGPRRILNARPRPVRDFTSKSTAGAFRSRRFLWLGLVFGVFVLADLGLFGWLMFRSLSEREINRVILEARTEAEDLAEQIAGEAERSGQDLFTAMAIESETRSYIDSVLTQRDIVDTVEIFDSEGRLVFRNRREEAQTPETSEIGDSGELTTSELMGTSDIVTRHFLRETPYEQVQVPVGGVGSFVIGISGEELEARLGILRGELLRQASVTFALTLALLLAAYFIGWNLWRRAVRFENEAKESERLAYVGTLASGLAHEIRSPLNSLNLNMQMLQEEFQQVGSPGTAPRLLAITRSEISRLERLVSDFLRYAKPPSLELEVVPAVDQLRQVTELMAAQLAAERVEVEISDTSDGARIEVDREQIEQLFLNLVGNAIEAMAETAAPRLRLGVAEKGDRVRLSVEDNGQGLEPDQLERVFDVFYSLRKGGTGLGLAIVERIAHNHGGSVWAESPPGRGARFVLELAASATEETSRVPAPAPATSPASS